MGASSGSMAGGLLTDWLGYHLALGIGASLTLFGAVFALIFLPETRGLRETSTMADASPTAAGPKPARRAEFASVAALIGVNRLAVAGILMSTFGLFLFEQIGDSLQIAGHTIGVATLTGIGLGSTALVSMVSAPILGGLSDRASSRWQVAAGGLTPGVAGFGLLALGSPLAILLGLPLTAITSGGNQSLSTAIVGDLSSERERGRRLGLLFTIGDLTSAVGPPLAYALIPLIGLNGLYLLSGGLFAAVLLLAWQWAVRLRPNRVG